MGFPESGAKGLSVPFSELERIDVAPVKLLESFIICEIMSTCTGASVKAAVEVR